MNWLDDFKVGVQKGHVDSASNVLLRNLEANDFPANEVAAVSAFLAAEYRQLNARPIHALLNKIEPQLQGPQYQAILADLQADLEATRLWVGRLDEIGSERLVNGLVQLVKSKQMDAAGEAIVSLMGSVQEDFRSKRAALIGHILGTLVHERERTAALVKQMTHNPMKYGLDALVVTDLEEAYARGNAEAARRDPAANTGVGRQQHTEAVVELSRLLPGRNAISEPTPEEIAKFTMAMQSIARCCILSAEHDRFHEALPLFVEFSPKEVSTAGALAGVEQRLYPELGRTARTVSARVLTELGANPLFIRPMIQFTQQHLDERIGRVGIETIGLMHASAGLPLALTAMQNTKSGAHNEAVFALGTLGSEQAVNALQKQLMHDLRGKVVTGEARRDAFIVISAYGRAVRSVKDPAQRSRLIIPIVKLLPKEDLEFAVRSVLNFFIGSQENMDPALLRWAAQVAVNALWSSDRPELARAGANQVLGFRRPLIDLLGRLAPQVLPTINAEVLKHSKTYNAAYLAMGEFYAKYPDPSAVEVIRQLLFNLSLHDDTEKNVYQKDTVRDVATEQQTELTKDRVIASLAFALDKIDSPEAIALLAEMYDQVRSGALPPPGPETSEILMKAREKAMGGSAKGLAPKTAKSPLDDFAFPEMDDESAPAADAPPTVAPQASPASISAPSASGEALIKDLTGKYLMPGKRREKKVSAMAQLSMQRYAQAPAIIIDYLTDTDGMIAAAAETSLLTFLRESGDAGSQAAVRAVTDTIARGDNAHRVKAAELLEKIGLGHPAATQVLEILQGRDLPVEARAVVDSLTRESSGKLSPHAVQLKEGEKEKLGSLADYLPKKQASTSNAPGLTDMDMKRAYMQARQDWIRGGKQGPEPKPPGSGDAE